MRIALVAGPDPGHAYPVLGVADALASRGHATSVATGAQREADVAAGGHDFVALPLLDPTAGDGDFGHRLWRRAGQMAGPLHELLAPLEPDLVIADTLTTVGAFVATLLSVAWVEVVPHHLTDPDPLVPPIGMGRAPAGTAARRQSDAEIRALQVDDITAGHRLRDHVRSEHGLGPHEPPVLRLLQTLPGLEPPRSRWPPDAHVVGSLAIDPALPRLEPPTGDGPLVVVADSTASGVPQPLGELAMRGLGGGHCRVVVTGEVGEQVPPNVVVGRGPHGPLLRDADVAVTAGGGGFTAKALTRGVALVVVPLAGDQQETAGRVANAGAGCWLPPEQAAPASLAAAVAQVLEDDSHTAAARRLALGAQGLGPDHAADLVEAAVRGNPSGRLTPAGDPDVRGPS